MDRSVSEIKARTKVATKYRGYRSLMNLMTAVTTDIPTPQFMMRQINAADLYLKEPYETTDHDAACLVHDYIMAYRPGGVPDDYNGVNLQMDAVEKQHYDDLRADFRALFGSKRDERLNPCESFYTQDSHDIEDADGNKTTSVALAVEAFFAANDMEARGDFGTDADHIAVECGFLAFSTEKIMRALVHFDEDEVAKWQGLVSTFLGEHTLNFAPTYFDNVVTLAQTDYYRGMALLGKAAFADMASELGVGPSDPAPASFTIAG